MSNPSLPVVGVRNFSPFSQMRTSSSDWLLRLSKVTLGRQRYAISAHPVAVIYQEQSLCSKLQKAISGFTVT